MVIFIDESGTHKQTGYANVAVVYIEINNLEKTERQLEKVLEELKLEVFHWADQGWKVREKFFNKLININFTFKIAIFENPAATDLMIETVFQHLITEKVISNIFIDGKKPKWYENKLKKVLRDKAISVNKLRTVRNERSHVGLQLADALAGLVRYHFDNLSEKDAQRLFKKLKRDKKLTAQMLFETETIKKFLRQLKKR